MDILVFLADLDGMQRVIHSEYGSRELDLLDKFVNTELLDKLFSEELIMITWGIHSYSYPIYSSSSDEDLVPLLGESYGAAGYFNIAKDIEELSIVPGYELNNWPNLLNKTWPKLRLYGKGKKTSLTPYLLKDNDDDTVIVSFLVKREEGELEEAEPLLNINLLY